VLDGARVRVIGLAISNLGPNGIGVRCEPVTAMAPTPSVELEQVSIDATGPAVFGNPCTISVARSHLRGLANQPPLQVVGASAVSVDRTFFDGGDGIQAIGAGAVVHVTNSIITNQTGPDGAFVGGSFGGSGGNGFVFVSFSTVINSLVKCPSGTPACSGGSGAGACIDNSIIFAPTNTAQDTVTGSACVANYTIVFPQTTALTGANNQLGANPLLKSPTTGDFHLTAGSPAIQAADPLATDHLDFDGVTRPAQGTRRCIGSYEFVP